MKSDRTLSSSAWKNISQLWQKRERLNRRKGLATARRNGLRLEFLESRDLFHAGEYDPSAAFHIHAQLDIFVNGVAQVIPQGVGDHVPGEASPTVHTHAADGQLHMHYDAGVRAANDFVKLDEFFDHWRRDTTLGNANAVFSSTNILGNNVDATHTIRFYVNGELNTDFQNYQVHDKDNIVISYEPLTTADAPTILPMKDVTVLAGSPLYIPLNGFDTGTGALTFTASSSNTNVLTTYIPQNNSTLKMSVADYGDMYFQLFDDKAARPAQRVETLANQGFYNGVIFHRVVNNFVIQGGDPTGTGSGGSQLGNFDDQFNVDLQHNRTGLLSFAKTTDDTNNSQFFITEGPQRHLDFNHSVFGMLIAGENVRELISEAAVGSNSRPTTNIVMSSVQVVADTKNNVLMLKAPQGTTGASDVTVTVTDATGKTFQQTFHVTVTPDTTNGGPFLNDIQPVHVLAGQTSTFQLTSQDAEGNPVNYAIEKQGTQTNYSLSVNSTTGVVTITPPVGFTGTLQAKATLTPTTPTDTGDTSDIQVFSITVDANRIPTVDLDAASDTGVSQTDNVTKATTLVFNLTNVQAGDTVRLFDGATQVGEQVATGTTVAITVNTVTPGVHSYTSRTVVNGVVSSASTALAVTVDTTPPLAINTTAPTRATATELYSYDAGHPDESLGLVRYSVAGATPQDPAPAGMDVNAETGLVTWTPTAGQTGAQAFTLIASDPAGNTAEQLVNLTVNPFVAAQAEIAIDFLDVNGNPITSIAQEGEFFVRAQVRDLNGAPAGISTFETDVTYDAAKVTTTTGNFVFGLGSNFNALTGGNKTTPGLLDEVGALDGTFTRSNSPDFFELFRIKLKATGTGPVLFQTDPAENGRVQISTFASPNPLDVLAVRFGSATLTIQSSFTAVADLFGVQEESSANSLDVLLNDTSLPGTTNVLTIVSIENKSAGTTIEVSPNGDRVLYTPAANFVGQDTFTYVVRNQNNETNTATVTVNVSNQNDPPTAVADTATVAEDSTTTIPVMGNDSSAPDVGETLRIDSLGTPSNGGTVSIAAGNAGVVYKPAANFFGTETFTYTINDGFGGLATATVTVTVTPTNDNPTAADDSLSIAEDSAAVTVTVLSNDNSQPDGPETLTVTAVGTGSKGGTITLTDGVVRYAPALNFFGEETFTYTISDGNGGTATAAVRVNVVNANDPPVGVADTVTGFKNTTDFLFNGLLSNDTSGVDPTENLVIASVAAGSQGGQLKVSTDGKGVLYTPAHDFVGAETFVYTLRDPGGATATATVTVNVQNFVPSTFSGAVFEDSNGNGSRDTNEAALSNVLITLTGKDNSNQSVSLTTRSLNDGSYKFSNLAPGTYTITESQPQFKDDGVEKLGNAGGTAGEDKFTITLAENTTATGYNFTEKGTPTKNVLVTDIFARRRRTFVSAAVSPTGSSFSQVAGTAWQAYDTTQLSLNSAGDQLTILATDHSSQQYSVTIPLSDTSKIQERGSENGQMYLRLLANPTDLNFVKIGGGTSTNAPVVTTTASAIAYTENTSLVIDDGLLLSDPDSSTLTSATVGISTNYFRDSDFLEFTNQAGITGSFNSTTGTLTLQGAASVSAYQAALRTVKFRINATLPSTAGRTITFSASDGANTSASATRLVTVTTVNDAPVATTSSGTTPYTTGAAGVAIDDGLTVTDVDSPVLSGATVSITTGFQVGQDQLDFTTQNGITGNYNQSTGQLVLTGNSTVANYQTALRSVKYRTTNASANLFTRNVAFIVNDGSAANAQSAIASKQITVTGQPNVFTINASALNGASVGAVTATQATTGALVYQLDNSTQNSKLNLRPGDHLSGNLNGSIILVEYMDLQCPVCRNYYPVLEAMKQQFGDDLLIVQRHFPIEPNHPLARAAARAAEAAHKQGKFKEMVDLMFTRQSVWSPLQNASAAADPTATFESYATELGLNLTQFRADSAVGVADALIDSDKADAIALGGTGAPTMFLNGGSKITLPGATNEAFAALLQPVKDGLTNIFNINHTTGQLTLRNRSALNPATTPTLQVPVRITDSAGVSQVVQVTVNVTANSSPVITLSAGNSSFSEGSSAAPVDALLTVADTDSTNLVGATVTIATGYQSGQDSLTFVTQNGITGDFNAGTGVLTLTGSSSVANYQAALRTIGFNNPSQAPTAGTRTLQIVVNDGTTASTLVTKTLGVTALNDAPVVTPTTSPLAYLENAGPVIVDAGLAVVDVDSANLTGATISISVGNSGSEDELLFDAQNGITGLYNSLSGQLSLTGTSSVENYQTALRSIRYRNNSENPTVTSRTIRFVVGDGGNENNTSAEVTRVINLTAVNDAPQLATTSSGPLTYTAATAATVIDPLISVNDSELDNFTGGKVTISAGFVTEADVLAVTNMHGITGTFNTTTGELTLTGNATVSQYQELLRTVTFHNAAAFGASSRTITFQLTDAGSPAGVSNDLTRNIAVESGGTAEGEGFFASLGEELPEGDNNTNLSQEDFTANVDDFYTLVGE